MRKKFLSAFLLAILILCGGADAIIASETTGQINVGLQTGMEGIIKAAPTASPAAGTYTSTQSVSLSASGSTAICYTTNGATPACSGTTACSAGTKYSSAISVASTLTIKSVACYADSTEGPAGTAAYTISAGTITPSGGGGGGGYVADTTAPVISNIIAKPTTGNTANITWSTNEGSLSWVVYGTTTAYGQQVKTTSYISSHSVNLIGLTPNTVYHYQVKAQDSSGNIAVSASGVFTTLGQGESASVEEPSSSSQTPAASSAFVSMPVPSKPLNEMNRTELISFLFQIIAAIQSGASAQPASGAIAGIPSAFSFQNNLFFGMSATDVKYLQIVLNSNAGTKVSLTGPGSPGNETMMFGNATLAAVKKFQVKYGIANMGNAGYGLVGPMTRSKLNSLLGK